MTKAGIAERVYGVATKEQLRQWEEIKRSCKRLLRDYDERKPLTWIRAVLPDGRIQFTASLNNKS